MKQQNQSNLWNFAFLNMSNKQTNIFTIIVAILELLLVSSAVFSTILNLDEIEHLHASWLVWSGQVPYRDFFEHHNPLFWFLFAPLTGLMYDNAYILIVARTSSILFNALSWYFIYKIITQYISNSKVWILTIIALINYNYYGYLATIGFRPDMLMYTLFWAGLYYYFEYFKTLNYKKLAISFTLFTLSFLFLQKIILILFVLGIFTLFQLYHKKILWKDIYLSLIIPTTLLLIFISYLVYTQSFVQYLTLNFSLNKLIPVYYGLNVIRLELFSTIYLIPFTNGSGSVNFSAFSVILIIIALLCLHKFTNSEKSIYKKCIKWLFIGELIIRYCTFSPYYHYFILLQILSLVIIGTTIVENKNKILNILATIFIGIWLFLIPDTLKLNFQTKNIILDNIKLMQYVIDNTKPDEPILNGNRYIYNIFRPDTHYQWFGFGDICFIYNQNFANNEFEINQNIEQTLPKFVIIKEYYNSTYYNRLRDMKDFNYNLISLYNKYPYPNVNIQDIIFQNKYQPISKIDEEMIHKYYEPVPEFEEKGLLQRKKDIFKE